MCAGGKGLYRVTDHPGLLGIQDLQYEKAG